MNKTGDVAASRVVGNMHVIDRQIEVPLDWNAPANTATIHVFFREVCAVDKRDDHLPLLLFLQGGPGGKSPRPGEQAPTWLKEAVQHFRVILPDQRGTGRSTRITGETMAGFTSSDAAADYLMCFDAHAIVADFEHIRNTLYQGVRWSTLGQSYGGFLTLTYLSWAWEGVEKSYITGGIPALQPDADKVYGHTYQRVVEKMQAHYARFPEDEVRLGAVADYLQTHRVTLPNGDLLTVERLQLLGLMLGMSDGSERLHWLLEEAFVDADAEKKVFNRHFLIEVMRLTGLDDNPLFAVMHEHIYANGDKPCHWAAQRQRPASFDPDRRPLYLTGEMIYPWMFETISALQPFREAVNCLAQRTQPKPYYCPEQLRRNPVPVAAAIYYEDMFVESMLSMQSVEMIKGVIPWVTNEYEHDGLRQDERVFRRLLALNTGRDRGDG